ncbi:Gamma-tubulin complex component 5 (Fragment) [Linum perenne]
MSIQTETLLTLGEGIHYATPVIPSSTATESEIVRSVLQMLQGLSLSAGSLFLWDANSRSFRVSQPGVYLTHLSRSSLHNLLHQFVYAASCLQLVEIFLDKLRAQGSKLPTLSAFVNSACCWLKRLRDVALEEEMKVCNSSVEVTPTLLGLSSSLSRNLLMISLCSGAEYLMQTVYGAVPRECLEQGSSISAAQVAVHILDYLYKKMDKVCLVEGGEEEAYRMVLHMLVACLLPYIESLDSWLFEGILDDPCEEMFFYANGVISIDDSGFWEKSYQLRQEQYQKLDVDNSTLSSSVLTMKGKKELGNKDSSSVKGKEDTKRLHVCPLFISDMAKAIVSAGKSLQLIRHVPASVSYSSISTKSNRSEIDGLISCEAYHNLTRQQKSIAGLTLSEIFCVSVTGLVGHGDHVYKYLLDDISQSSIASTSVVDAINKDIHNRSNGISTRSVCSEKVWYKFMLDALQQKKVTDLNLSDLDVMEKYNTPGNVGGSQLPTSFCPENPVLTVCQGSLENHKEYWNTLNLSRKFCLPPLNDERPSTPSGTSTRKTHPHNFGLDALASLNFTYKVSWPLELIANAEAIKKYNQVMTFLLKVKRVKFVLDKVRKWMWKSKGRVRNSSKRHWLVEQKLLHFIDAFHQHVMDGVYHSAWRELCEGMTVAGSLDEVMEVHEAYLLSIQRQCFVVPGKLWSVIANRINRILNLALDFYAIQQTLNSDEAASPMKAKCETTVEQIEKSFNDCIAVLLRVLSVKVNVKHFPHLADLVARINYNYFYVSDNGTLRTNTSSGTATSRIGKVFIT